MSPENVIIENLLENYRMVSNFDKFVRISKQHLHQVSRCDEDENLQEKTWKSISIREESIIISRCK